MHSIHLFLSLKKPPFIRMRITHAQKLSLGSMSFGMPTILSFILHIHRATHLQSQKMNRCLTIQLSRWETATLHPPTFSNFHHRHRQL